MIEVRAKVCEGTVFLSGQGLRCEVSFTHVPQPEHETSQSHSDVLENLAWASAQIHCYYSTKDTTEVSSPVLRRVGSIGGKNTSLQTLEESNEKVALQTTPKILFCDLTIPRGETKTFIYRETLPLDTPPSYRGARVKYSYKVTVATQRVNSPIKMIRIPLRVLSIGNIVDLSESQGICCNETTEELQRANPFSEERKVETPLNIALQVLQNITARRNPNFYMITNARGKVARFCIFKSAYRLGEDVVGTFDFSVGTVRCIQVSVALQSEEEMKSHNGNVSDNPIKPVTFARYHEVTVGFDKCQLILPIPLHATPTFETDITALKWRLHFEFVTSTSQELDPKEDQNEWMAPLDVPIETMIWNLPIKIYPTIPKQIPYFCQSSNEYSLIIK